jgi:hypothetical protein
MFYVIFLGNNLFQKNVARRMSCDGIELLRLDERILIVALRGEENKQPAGNSHPQLTLSRSESQKRAAFRTYPHPNQGETLLHNAKLRFAYQ